MRKILGLFSLVLLFLGCNSQYIVKEVNYKLEKNSIDYAVVSFDGQLPEFENYKIINTKLNNGSYLELVVDNIAIWKDNKGNSFYAYLELVKNSFNEKNIITKEYKVYKIIAE